MALVIFYFLLALMALGVPIVLALIFAPIMGVWLDDKMVFLNMMPQRVFGGINQFPLLAIPMFILAGSILIPAMEKDGYTRRFAAAVTASSAVIGPVIPPSIITVVYAYIMGVSVGG